MGSSGQTAAKGSEGPVACFRKNEFQRNQRRVSGCRVVQDKEKAQMILGHQAEEALW